MKTEKDKESTSEETKKLLASCDVEIKFSSGIFQIDTGRTMAVDLLSTDM